MSEKNRPWKLAAFALLVITMVLTVTLLSLRLKHEESTAVLNLSLYESLSGAEMSAARAEAEGQSSQSADEADTAEPAKNQWVSRDNVWYFAGEDGEYVKASVITDAGKSYYLDESGALVTDQVLTAEDHLYTADANGELTPATGWQEIGDTWYFGEADGTLKKEDFADKDGISVFLNAEGAGVFSGFYTWEGDLYYAEADGSRRTASGWFELDGSTYYAGEDGKFSHCEYISVDGNYYFMDRNGVRLDGIPKIDQYLGCAGLKQWMEDHFSDYYFKTNYGGIWQNLDTPDNLLRPYGEYGDESEMNCTGFISHLVRSTGGDLQKLVEMECEGGYIDADSYLYLGLRGLVEYEVFNSVDELLASGKAKKGDIMYLAPKKSSDPDAYIDCHLGLFWGDTPSENRFWSQARDTLCTVTDITMLSPIGKVYLFPIDGQ